MANKLSPGRRRLCKKIPAQLSQPDELPELSRADAASEVTDPHFSPVPHHCWAVGVYLPSDKSVRHQRGLLHPCSIFWTSITSSACLRTLSSALPCSLMPSGLAVWYLCSEMMPFIHKVSCCLLPTAILQHWVPPDLPRDACASPQTPNKGSVMRQAPRCCSQQTVCHLDPLCSGKPLSLQIFVFKCFSAHLI